MQVANISMTKYECAIDSYEYLLNLHSFNEVEGSIDEVCFMYSTSRQYG